MKKWAIIIGADSKVIFRQIHFTSSMLWAPSFLNVPKVRAKGEDTTESETADFAYLVFDDEALAGRVSQAFRRTAELCRGKEPF